MLQRPFWVFGVESPSFGYRMISGRYIWDHASEDERLAGSVIGIGGGYLSPATPPMIEPTGSLNCSGWQFCERIVAKLVKPDHWVTVVYDTLASTYGNWLDHARDANFEIIETDETIVCLGKGRFLPELHWMQGVSPVSATCLTASPNRESLFEHMVIDAAKGGVNVRVLVDDFWSKMQSKPEAFTQSLKGYSLIATVGGLDYSDIFITRSESDVSLLRDLLCMTASELDTCVYDAGSIADLLSTGYFAWDEEWRPLPPEWRPCNV